MKVAMMQGVSAVVESVVARLRTVAVVDLVVVVIVFLHGIVDEDIGRRRG